MYNLLIAIASAILSFVIASFAIGGGEFKPLYGIVPGLVVGLGLYAWLARRTMTQVQEMMKGVEKHIAVLQADGRQPTPDELNAAVDEAVAQLKEGYVFDRWQFLVKAQLDGHIGQLYFMTRRYQEAIPFLKGALKQNWVAQAQLATLYYKKKKKKRMAEVFEEAVSSSKKESLLWNLYAWCTWKLDDTDEAIKILVRATEHIESDERTKENLLALQNGHKMKMRTWDMMWYQFHLDHPPEVREQLQQRRQVRQQIQHQPRRGKRR